MRFAAGGLVVALLTLGATSCRGSGNPIIATPIASGSTFADRWIILPVHLKGWDYARKRDTLFVHMLQRGTIENATEFNVDVEYDTLANNSYQVVSRPNYPGARPDTAQVRVNESFFIGVDTLFCR